MPRMAPPLAVSPPERLILETVVASEQLPENVRTRARVVLMAGDGAKNCTIGLELGMHRSRVLYWRRRFSDSGIRGLWDREGVLPQDRIPQDVEQAIIFDCLYRQKFSWEISRQMPWDPSLTWNVRNLARRHNVSRATVQRVLAKQGIHMLRRCRLDQGVELERLKISDDPLFGVTVYQIGGLFYYGTTPILVFCSRGVPFSELTFSGISLDARREIADEMSGLIRNLDQRNLAAVMPNSEGGNVVGFQLLEFLRSIRSNPRHADAEIHLLAEGRTGGALNDSDIREFLTGQPSSRLRPAPWAVGGRNWSRWVECWLRRITAWPLQTSFINSAYQIRDILRRQRDTAGAIVVC